MAPQDAPGTAGTARPVNREARVFEGFTDLAVPAVPKPLDQQRFQNVTTASLGPAVETEAS